MAKDLTKCSTCQVAEPVGLVCGRYYATCASCYTANQAKREANRVAKAKAFKARVDGDAVGPVFHLTVGDEIVGRVTMESLLNDNEGPDIEGTEDLCAFLRSAKVGEVESFLGGAAPVVTLERLS